MTASDSSSSTAAASTEQTAMQTKLLTSLARQAMKPSQDIIKAHQLNCKITEIITEPYKITRLTARIFQWFSTSFRWWFMFSLVLQSYGTEKINFINIHTYKYTLCFQRMYEQEDKDRHVHVRSGVHISNINKYSLEVFKFNLHLHWLHKNTETPHSTTTDQSNVWLL